MRKTKGVCKTNDMEAPLCKFCGEKHWGMCPRYTKLWGGRLRLFLLKLLKLLKLGRENRPRDGIPSFPGFPCGCIPGRLAHDPSAGS